MPKPLINLILVPLNEDTPCLFINNQSDLLNIKSNESFKLCNDKIINYLNYFDTVSPFGITYLPIIKGINFKNNNVLNNDWFKEIAFNNEVSVWTIDQTRDIQLNLYHFLKQDLPGYKGLKLFFDVVN